MDRKRIEEAARVISSARAMLIGAGAGMGVDSGLPDFRGRQGFWRAYPPFAKLGLGFEDLANPQWFARDPELAWGFYGHRLNLYRGTEPHEGFHILQRWANRMDHGCFVFTSNVDGQFQKASFPDARICECHGSIHYLQCAQACTGEIWEARGATVAVNESTFRASQPLPACPHCQAVARPNILMFGDWGWIAERAEAQEQRLEEWLRSVGSDPIAVVECGAGLSVPTVRMRCERTAEEADAALVRINPREPRGPSGTIPIMARALDALYAIDAVVSAKRAPTN